VFDKRIATAAAPFADSGRATPVDFWLVFHAHVGHVSRYRARTDRGSIGLAALREGVVSRVIGIGRSQTRLQTAISRGAISEGTLDLAAGVRDADLIVVCTPVDEIPYYVERAAEACQPGALITDAGSTKADLVARVQQARAEATSGKTRSISSAAIPWPAMTSGDRTMPGPIYSSTGWWSSLQPRKAGPKTSRRSAVSGRRSAPRPWK